MHSLLFFDRLLFLLTSLIFDIESLKLLGLCLVSGIYIQVILCQIGFVQVIIGLDFGFHILDLDYLT